MDSIQFGFTLNAHSKRGQQKYLHQPCENLIDLNLQAIYDTESVYALRPVYIEHVVADRRLP